VATALIYSEDQVLAALRKAIKEAGSLRAWARANEFSPGFVSQVLQENMPPSPRLAEAIGFRRETVYFRL
jgi:hypothetical protein